MPCYVFWTAIAGVQYTVLKDYGTACLNAQHLICSFKHTSAYVYDPSDNTWEEFTPGVRGRAQYCETPEDEVPKAYRLLVLLEN